MMKEPTLVLTYDVGTTGVKTCLFELGESVRLIDSEMAGYELYILEGGGAEQDPAEWWAAMCATTKLLLGRRQLDPAQIKGVSFCSQMQCLVLVDQAGKPVRRAMSYMDQRAREQLKKGLAYGIQIAGANVVKLLKSLQATGAVAASVKDPVWKYKWVQQNEPAVFARVHKWLDAKEYLICKMTDAFIMTEDSAYAALLYNIRKGREGWSKSVCDMLGVRMEHLATIVKCTDEVGQITQAAASELGLMAGTPVFGGGGDASLIGVGAGATRLGDTHIYSGTSGWVSTVVDKSIVDASAMIAAILGAQPGRFNYFAELETAGKCLEWVKDHLALDEIDIYLEKKHVAESKEALYTSLYDYMTKAVQAVPAGANGVIFTPWLHGNRCPFEDPNVRGMFFNISLETGKTEMIRAVLEGVCLHMRWFLETQEKKIKTSDPIRFVGGGALSEVTCQILADCTGKTVETVDSPQNVGSFGAAVLIAVGIGLLPAVDRARDMIPVKKTFRPDGAKKAAYDKNFAVFKELYRANKKNFAALNG